MTTQDEAIQRDRKNIKTSFANYGYGHKKLMLACTIFTHHWTWSLAKGDRGSYASIARTSDALKRALIGTSRLRETQWLKDYFEERGAYFAVDSVRAEQSFALAHSGEFEAADEELASIKNVRARRNARTEVVRKKITAENLSQAFAEISTVSSASDKLELLCDLIVASARAHSPDTNRYLAAAHEIANHLPVPTVDQLRDSAQHPLEHFAQAYLIMGREEEYIKLICDEEKEALLRDHLLESAIGAWMWQEEFANRLDLAQRVLQLIHHPLFRANAIVLFLIQLHVEEPEEALKYLWQLEEMLKASQEEGLWYDQDLYTLNESYLEEYKEYFASLLEGRESAPAQVADLEKIVLTFLDRGDFLYALRIARKNKSASAYKEIVMRYIHNKQLDAALDVCRGIKDPSVRFETLYNVVVWLCAYDDVGRFDVIMPFVELVEQQKLQLNEVFMRQSIILWCVLSKHVIQISNMKIETFDRKEIHVLFDEALLQDEGSFMLAGILLNLSEHELAEMLARVPLDKQKRVQLTLSVINRNPFANAV